MIYDWIRNRNRFRVQVPDVEGGKALIWIVGGYVMLDAEETFIRNLEEHPIAIVYLVPEDEDKRSRTEDILDKLDKIGA
jgi:hypothetical protein